MTKIDKERQRERERVKERQKKRDKERERERQRLRHSQKDRVRETGSQKDKERERERESLQCYRMNFTFALMMTRAYLVKTSAKLFFVSWYNEIPSMHIYSSTQQRDLIYAIHNSSLV